MWRGCVWGRLRCQRVLSSTDLEMTSPIRCWRYRNGWLDGWMDDGWMMDRQKDRRYMQARVCSSIHPFIHMHFTINLFIHISVHPFILPLFLQFFLFLFFYFTNFSFITFCSWKPPWIQPSARIRLVLFFFGSKYSQTYVKVSTKHTKLFDPDLNHDWIMGSQSISESIVSFEQTILKIWFNPIAVIWSDYFLTTRLRRIDIEIT